MCIYFILFIYYIVQLSVYRDGIHKGENPDSIEAREYIQAVDSLLLILSLAALVTGWLYRNIFEKYYVVYNSLLFGLTFGWLILTAPEIHYHRSFYGLNVTVSLMLIVVDVIAQLYVRPEVISVNKPRSSSLWRNSISSSTKYGKVKRNSHDEGDSKGIALGIIPNPSGGSGTKPKEPGSSLNIISDEERSIASNNNNNNNEFFQDEFFDERNSTIRSSSRGGSLSSFYPLPPNEAYNNDILYLGKVDLTEKGVCDGFRINLAKLPINNPNLPHNLTWDHFQHIQHLIDSSSCHIYTAFWDDLPVVLKLIKAERITSPVAVAEFDMEENILSRIRHPNIVRLLGSGTTPRKFLVLELLSGGSLSHSLGLRPDSQNNTWQRKFTFLETLRLALDLAKAINYLHGEWSPGSIHIIHRDIKPDNIGWTSDGALKIFDFGLCVAVKAQREKTEQYRLTGNTGTLRYMAPEVVLGRSYNQTVDAYSFGILIWQVCTGRIPFREMGKKPYFDRVVIGGQRPKLEPQWPMAFGNLLKSCWHEDKNMRPTFAKIVSELEILVKAEEESIRIQQNQFWNRFSSFCLSVCLTSRPLLLFIVLAVFIISLIVIIAQNDTILGSCLGMLSSFVIYAILMSYLKIWPTMTTGGERGSGNGGVARRARQFRSNSLDIMEHFKNRSASLGGPGGISLSSPATNSNNTPSRTNDNTASNNNNNDNGSLSSRENNIVEPSTVVVNESGSTISRRHGNNNNNSTAAGMTTIDLRGDEDDDIELQAGSPGKSIIETNYSFNPLNRSLKKSSGSGGGGGSLSMV
jgi:serine/threonine protein kinase